MRTVLGADVIPAPLEDSTGAPERLPVAPAVLALTPAGVRRYGEPGPSLPEYWPIDSLLDNGVITRGFTPPGDGLEPHPGVDIAVPRGTPIHAAGGGTVADAGFDREYGQFVLVQHPSGYQTMYGHASRLLVRSGDQISAGQVIALSGSTGRSTAPHLHFEKRQGDLVVDPLESISEDS